MALSDLGDGGALEVHVPRDVLDDPKGKPERLSMRHDLDLLLRRACRLPEVDTLCYIATYTSHMS